MHGRQAGSPASSCVLTAAGERPSSIEAGPGTLLANARWCRNGFDGARADSFACDDFDVRAKARTIAPPNQNDPAIAGSGPAIPAAE
jgi:hypothetical protein